MYLFELFQESGENDQKNQQPQLVDDLYWYILDNDHLHKNHGLSIIQSKDAKKAADWHTWMPMVKKGCIMYYNENEMTGHPRIVFDKDMRKEVCQKIAEYYHDQLTETD